MKMLHADGTELMSFFKDWDKLTEKSIESFGTYSVA